MHAFFIHITLLCPPSVPSGKDLLFLIGCPTAEITDSMPIGTKVPEDNEQGWTEKTEGNSIKSMSGGWPYPFCKLRSQ
jgi:hypothetical protein